MLQYINVHLRSTAKRLRVTMVSTATPSRTIHVRQGYVERQGFGLMSFDLSTRSQVPAGWQPTSPIKRVSAVALWQAYTLLSPAQQQALVPDRILFHDWTITELTSQGLSWLESTGHWFAAQFSAENQLDSFSLLIRSPRQWFGSFCWLLMNERNNVWC